MSRLPRSPHFISVRWEMGQIGEDGVGILRPPSSFACWGMILLRGSPNIAPKTCRAHCRDETKQKLPKFRTKIPKLRSTRRLVAQSVCASHLDLHADSTPMPPTTVISKGKGKAVKKPEKLEKGIRGTEDDPAIVATKS